MQCSSPPQHCLSGVHHAGPGPTQLSQGPPPGAHGSPIAFEESKGSPRATRFVELTIPDTEKLLGFSVGVRPRAGGDCLVVTNVRALSVLHDHGVEAGARLVKLNGDDVAHFSLDDLTAKARALANTTRRVVLAIDPAPPA